MAKTSGKDRRYIKTVGETSVRGKALGKALEKTHRRIKAVERKRW